MLKILATVFAERGPKRVPGRLSPLFLVSASLVSLMYSLYTTTARNKLDKGRGSIGRTMKCYRLNDAQRTFFVSEVGHKFGTMVDVEMRKSQTTRGVRKECCILLLRHNCSTIV